MFLRRKFLGGTQRDELDAIRDNLHHVLSARRGTGFFLPTFGVTESGCRTPAETIERLSAEIRENLALYEPRLCVQEIQDHFNEDGSVRISVHCRVTSSDQRVQIVMGTKGQLLQIGLGDDDKSHDTSEGTP